MHSLKALLSGSQPLSKALGYLILGGFLVLMSSSVIGLFVIRAFPAARIGVYVGGFAVFWAYLFLAGIGTWRSANRAKKGWLTILAKAVVVLLAALFLLSVFRPNGIIAMVTGTWQPGSYLQEITKEH
jgi:hypothetical protein